jgi:arylsulfatase A-like enzyme
MKSVFLGLILGLLAALSAAPSAGQGAGRPNIVFILFDDLGYGSLGVYGSELVETPNVDAVARQGMRFTQYYANAPVCSPTRAGLLTGLHPSHLGIRQAVRLPDDKGVPRGVVTVPALLKGRGYATGHVGKWHLGRLRPEFSPESHGFDEAIVFHPPSYADPLFSSEGRFFRVKGHATELMVDYVLDFLRRRAPSAPGDPPFFLNLWLFAPHLPLDELPPRGAPYPDDLTEREAYAVLVEDADAHIRRILDELERLGLADDTMVVITSDNGGYPLSRNPVKAARIVPGRKLSRIVSNAPFANGKPNVFEGGIRVPLIVRWPGRVAAGTVNDSVVVGSDFLPTIAEIVGVPASLPDLYGESFLEVLLSGVDKERNGVLVWENKRAASTFAVRRGDWKLVRFQARNQLFDLGADAVESQDLAADRPDLVAELTQEYVRWRADVSRILPTYVALEGEVSLAADHGADLFTFSGAGGRAVLGRDARLDVNVDDFTFSAWVRLPAGPLPGKRVIAEKAGSWRLRLAGDRVVLDVTDREGWVYKLGHGPLAAGGWHQVAFTLFHSVRTEGTWVRLYVDPDELRPVEIYVTSGEVNPSERPVLIGAGADFASRFLGSIFDPRFYNASLCEPSVVAGCPLAALPRPE